MSSYLGFSNMTYTVSNTYTFPELEKFNYYKLLTKAGL